MIAKIQYQGRKIHFLKMFRFSLFLVFVLWSDYAESQYNYLSPLFDVNSGLPHNEVNDIVKDDGGYIWIATDNGLSRFDGYNFINFNHDTHPNIFKESRITKIHKKGSVLYLLTASDGLIELQPSNISFKKLYTANPLAMAFSNDTTAILFDSGKLVFIIKSKVIFIRKLNLFDKTDIAIYQGKVFVTLNNKELIAISPKSPTKQIKIGIQETDFLGKFFVSNIHGLVLWNGDVVRLLRNNKLVDHPDFIAKKHITFFGEDADGKHLFIEKSTIPFVVFERQMLGFFSPTIKQNIQNKFIFRLNKTYILVGTNQGIIRIEQKPALSYQIDDYSLNVDNYILQRRKIIEHKNKRFYIGYPRVLEENKGVISRFSARNLVTYDGLIFNDELFCSAEGDGLVSFDLQTKEITSHVNKHLGVHETFQSILKVSDSQILLCGGNKMVLYNPTNKVSKAFYLKNGIEIEVAVKNDNSNIIYLGTNKGLFRIQFTSENNFKILDSGKQLNMEVRDILLRKENNEIWLATYKGVFVLNFKNLKVIHAYTQPNQVSNPKVVKLVEDKSNCIWASTYSGITIYNTNDGTVRFINKNHLLNNFEYNNKSGSLLSDGKIAFGGLNSFEIIDPKALNEYKFAKTFAISGIETVKNENRKWFSAYREGQKISFSTGKEAIKIYLANLDYQYGNGYSFQYTLDSKNWFNVDKNHFILISNLSYGEYNLKIRMFNPFGQLVEEKTFSLTAKTSVFYKTEFLSFIFILVIIISILLVYTLRRSLRIKTQTKSRIAMDLHDESGTILTRLLMLSKKENIQEKDKELLQSGLREALYNFRTYINSISREKHTLQDLTYELKDFVTTSCADANIQVDFKPKYDLDYTIQGELYRDIKLSIYEIVTNCIKHANANQLSIKFLAIDYRLNILFTDNGFCNISDVESYKGNGIRNIKKRIERNKGNFNYYILEGASGLNIEISLPIL
jgi:ligand-binding sensor domain-containing protein/signal transduction histidine kinase